MPWLGYASLHIGELGALLYYLPALAPVLFAFAFDKGDGRARSKPTKLTVVVHDGLDTAQEPDGTLLVRLRAGARQREVVAKMNEALVAGLAFEVVDFDTGHCWVLGLAEHASGYRTLATTVCAWITSPNAPQLYALRASVLEPEPPPVVLRFSAGAHGASLASPLGAR